MGIMSSFTQCVQYPICLKCDRTFPQTLNSTKVWRFQTLNLLTPHLSLFFFLPRAPCCSWKTIAPASRHLKCLSMRPYSTWTLDYPAAPLPRRSGCPPSRPCWRASKAASLKNLSCSVTPHDPQTYHASPTTSYRSVWIHGGGFLAIRSY